MEVYRAVKLLHYAIKTFQQTDIIKLKEYLEIGTLIPHASVSAISIFSCIQI